MDNYSVSLVRRSPNQLTAPDFSEVAPIPAPSGLSWADILNREDEVTASCLPELLDEAARSAIRDQISDFVFDPGSESFVAVDPPALELWMWRGSVLVPGSGPIVGYQFTGTDPKMLAFQVRGPEYLLRFAYADTDISHEAGDQLDIGKGLVDQWQALDYGDFGIDTSGIGVSGTTRDRSYPRGDNVFQRLTELAEVGNGFDWWVDSARALNFSAEKGQDLTDTVTLDRRSVTNPNIQVAVSAGAIASVALALNTDDAIPLAGESENVALLQSFGRAGAVQAFEGVVNQATINDYADQLRDARQAAQVIPHPEAIPVAGADVMDFVSGDRIELAFDPGIGLLVFRRRVQAKRVTVSDDGNETLGVEFV